ncbi:MAG: dihydrolipoyl dehydrogenase [Sphingomonadales bacterium]
MSDNKFDLVVIGAGPGGYVAAIRAAQNGLRTACIEGRGKLGGTCLNVGCMPSKALLHASETYDHAKNHMEEIGIKTSGVLLDLKAMMADKDKTVNELTSGIEFLFKKNKVEYIPGWGTLKAENTIDVELNDGKTKTLKADNIIIATGSEVATLPGLDIDGKVVVGSTEALSFQEVPKHMVVIGGGVIGLEMGSIWQRLGAEVTVIEYMNRVLPTMDLEVSKTFGRTLKKQGFNLKMSTKVIDVKKTKSGATVTFEPAKGGKADSVDCDVVLMSIGRKPYTEGLGLEALGITLDKKGRISVDHNFATSVKGVFAIGDVIEGPMLAHKAEDEGIACADNISGLTGYVNHDVIPNVVYTMPEVASVGKTEEELRGAGIPYNSGKFSFSANSRAKANHETEGFVKVLADKDTDRVLGVHIIGSHAGNMIAEASLAMEFGASSEDIALTCHAHPTQTEALKEAAMAVTGKPIHM